MISSSRLRKIAREIRYRPFPELVGRKVSIQSLETAEKDILQELRELPEKCNLASRVNERAIAKYGILDLEFSVAPNFLSNNYETGIPLLKKFGFVVESTEAPSLQNIRITYGDKQLDDLTCLEELAQDLAKNQTLIKLFMRDTNGFFGYISKSISQEEKVKHFENLKLPSNYFPQIFIVVDACITNAGFIWFHHHFYL